MVESVKSADRVLDVLALLSNNMRGMTFTDICSELGWPKSSTHGLLATLQSRGFLDLNESDRRYSIGIRTWEVGQAYLGGQDLAQDALPYMQAVSYTHLRAHETRHDLVCRLLLEKKKK